MTSPDGATITHYHWQIQRHTFGLWAHDPDDPAGADRSDYSPEGFARTILAQHAPEDTEPWRLAVWDRPGVGAKPVYTITSDQAQETP